MMANLGCGAHTLQIIIFILNFAIWAAGLVILIVGLWAYLSGEPLPYLDIMNDADELWSAAIIVLLILAAFMFFMGFLGCYGAAKENSCLLHIYSFFVVAAIVTQVIIVILAIVFFDEIEGKLRDAMKEQIREKYLYEQTGTGIDGAWNRLMTENNCCGVDSYEDFENGVFWNATGGAFKVPYTCCRGSRKDGDNFAPPPVVDRRACNDEAGQPGDTFDFLYNSGCYTKMKDWIETRAVFLIALCCCFLALQILLLVMTCCVLQAMKRA